MSGGLLLIPGGVGLFLLGVTLLADGLRTLAGDRLRETLSRFTSTPARGAVAGAVATALIRSSSAMTVMAVGFVGAGLMTFPQALGLIFGANIGTTTTGWLVALLGFRLDFAQAALPLLFLGMMGRLFGGPRLRSAGWALVGFSLIFLGLDLLKEGMAGFQGMVTPASFPDAGWLGRIELALIGLIATLVTQSSSAGVAMALTALSAGAVAPAQAAAMVVGMDVGTTATAAIAAMGGSTAMRRTGLAHVIYNLMTGAAALLLLDPLMAVAGLLVGPDQPEFGLVAFHSLFNVLGVIAVVPFAAPFARLVERIIPERAPTLARRLDPRLTADPDAAADASAATIRDATAALADAFAAALSGGGAPLSDAAATPVAEAAAATERFLGVSTPLSASAGTQAREAACLHALDHLTRLARRARQTERAATLPRDRRLARLGRALAAALRDPDDAGRRERVHALIQRWREPLRRDLLLAAADGRLSPFEAERRLDAQRWLQRCAYHFWRIAEHMREARER